MNTHPGVSEGTALGRKDYISSLPKPHNFQIIPPDQISWSRKEIGTDRDSRVTSESGPLTEISIEQLGRLVTNGTSDNDGKKPWWGVLGECMSKKAVPINLAVDPTHAFLLLTQAAARVDLRRSVKGVQVVPPSVLRSPLTPSVDFAGNIDGAEVVFPPPTLHEEIPQAWVFHSPC